MPLSVTDIAKVSLIPEAKISAIWPLVVSALETQGINSDMTQVAAAATIIVETGDFLPKTEKMADPDKQPKVAALQARYKPFIGRGLIQITWKTNYKLYGDMIGVDLLSDPEQANLPTVAAELLAAFFKRNGIALAANNKNWALVRSRVNGPNPLGMSRFLSLVEGLTKAVSQL